MARGVDGREVFIDEVDRDRFLRLLLRLKSETPFSILAYCLMGNHFHLAVRVGRTPLSRIIQRLLTAYAIEFNSRHGRSGHLFQARYKAILCLDDSYLLGLVRYIHENPVRANLVQNPEEWPWSSFGDYIGRTESSITDTRLVGEVLQASGQAYRQWHSGHQTEFNPWPEVRATAAPELLREERLEQVPIDEIALRLFPDPLTHQQMRSGSRLQLIVDSRRLLAREAAANGHSLAAISKWIGCSISSVHHLLRRNNRNL